MKRPPIDQPAFIVRRAWKSDRDAWVISWGLTLVLHVTAILGLPRLSLFVPAPVTVRKPEPVRLVFKDSRHETRRTEEPHFFSELPPDRADAAPEIPDFLSNVTSRARGHVPGGDAALPRMQGEGDTPMVKLESNDHPSPALSTTTPPQTQPQTEMTEGMATSLKPRGPDALRPRSDDELDGTKGSAGNSDVDQPAMDRPYGSPELSGKVSLNTIAWEYAPWLQRFGRRVKRWWTPPPAYTLGILKEGGWGVFELEISRSGKVLRQELLEEQGHPSLIQAAQGALRGPVEPLPGDFPEPTLILRIRMNYPRIRAR